MADIHGSDGLLTADNLDMVRAVNFSGRLRKLPITKAHLQDALWKLDAHDCEVAAQAGDIGVFVELSC